MRNKAHTAPTAPLILHHTRIDKYAMAVIHRFFTCKIIVTHPVGKAINEMNTKTRRESLGRFCSPTNEEKIGQETELFM
jgi:hypothetical protein